MPAPKTANGLQVEMRYTSDGEFVENVFHVLVTSSDPPGTVMPTAAFAFQSWWTGSLRNYFSSTIALREIYVVDLTTADGPTYTLTPEAPIAGQAAGVALPNNCALVATKRTNQRGRAYRGRTYFCGIPEGDVVVSTATPSYVSDLNAACTGLLDDLTAANLALGVLSKRINKDWRPVGVITPVTTFALRNGVIDSQRERLPQ